MSSNVVHIDPEILGGTPVFKGTRVPVETFFDYIQGGEPLSEFLEDFPTVTEDQVTELLEEVKSEILPTVRRSVSEPDRERGLHPIHDAAGPSSRSGF
jgi:uncharacterized protein (DUF433 family)